VYNKARRHLQLVDTSTTGLRLQGLTAGWSAIAVGDLVALRRQAEPLVLGRVARAIPSLASGEIIIGVSRIPGSAIPVQVTRTSGSSAVDMLYISGDDPTGRDDGYLVSDRVYADRTAMQVTTAADTFTFRFNRVRLRGRGWVLAGFEIISAAREEPATAP
jgi:hypothetical protein